MNRFLWGCLFGIASLYVSDHIITLAFFSGQYYHAKNAYRNPGVAVLIILTTYQAMISGMAYMLLKKNHIRKTMWTLVSVAPISALGISGLSQDVSEAVLYTVASLVTYQFLVIGYRIFTKTKVV